MTLALNRHRLRATQDAFRRGACRRRAIPVLVALVCGASTGACASRVVPGDVDGGVDASGPETPRFDGGVESGEDVMQPAEDAVVSCDTVLREIYTPPHICDGLRQSDCAESLAFAAGVSDLLQSVRAGCVPGYGWCISATFCPNAELASCLCGTEPACGPTELCIYNPTERNSHCVCVDRLRRDR